MYSNFMKPTFMTTTSNSTFGTALGAASTSFGQTPTSTTMFPSMQPSNIFQGPSTSSFNTGASTQPAFEGNSFNESESSYNPQQLNPEQSGPQSLEQQDSRSSEEQCAGQPHSHQSSGQQGAPENERDAKGNGSASSRDHVLRVGIRSAMSPTPPSRRNLGAHNVLYSSAGNDESMQTSPDPPTTASMSVNNEQPPVPGDFYDRHFLKRIAPEDFSPRNLLKKIQLFTLDNDRYSLIFRGTSLFGQQSQPSTSGLFGNSSTFGQNKPGFGFGSTTAQSTGLFGQQPQQQATSSLFPTNTSNLFGSTSAFGGQSQMGTVVKFTPVQGSDTMQKNGVATSISTKHHCITCMKEYENKSLEELRFEDYTCNRKGPQQQSGFAPTPFGATAPTASTSLFGQTDNKQGFGQTTGFGQQSSTFGQSTSGFGLTNQNASTSLFGKPTGFGASTSNTTSFGFNPAASTSNPFNTSQPAKPFSTSLFGSTSTQPAQTGFGTSVFGQTTAQQNTGANLFQKPAQPTTGFNTTQTGFNFNQPTTTQTSSLFQTSKPSTGFGLFGQTNTGTSTFGQPTQTGFASSFGKPMTSTFGQQQTTGFGTSFGTGGLQQQSPFGSTQAKPSLFGNTATSGGSLFTNTFQQPSSFQLQPNMPQPIQFPSEQQDELKNISLIATDPFTDGSHIFGLDPLLADSSSSTTNPQDIKALLELSRKKEDLSNTRSKIKVQLPKTKRSSTINKDFFDANAALKSSRKCLVIRKFNEQPTTIYNKYKNELIDEAERALKASDSETSSVQPSGWNNIDMPEVDPAMRRIALKLRFDTSSDDSIQDRFPTDRTDRSLQRDDDLSFLPLDAKTSEIFTSEGERSVTSEDNTIANDNDNGNENDNENDNANENDNDTDSESSNLTNTNVSAVQLEAVNNPAGVILSRPEYYSYPPLKDLDQYLDEDGNCIVQGLTIGRRGYGNVYFPDPINITGMDLDEIIHFRHREIIVYPDESKKPPVGEGLNRRAQVTLDKIYPREKGTNTYITDVDSIIQSNFVDNLMAVTQKHNCKFVDYRPKTGSWVFKVKHFSKYAFTDSDEEECEIGQNLIIESSKEDLTLKWIHGKPDGPKVGLGGKKPAPKSILTSTVIEEDQLEDEEAIITGYWQDESLASGDKKDMKLIDRSRDELDDYEDDEKDEIIDEVIDEEQEQEPEQLLLAQPLVPEVLATPKVHVLSTIESTSTRSFGALRRCYIDLGLFKGDAYKVGWFRACKFFAPSPMSLEDSNSHALNLCTIPTYDMLNYDIMMPNLVKALEIALEESKFTFDDVQVPTLTIENGRSYLRKQAELFSDHVNYHEFAGDKRYLSSVWNLCMALWYEEDNGCAFTRKQHFSKWLQQCSYDLCNELKFDPTETLTKSQVVDTIFELLAFYKVEEAAKLAMKYDLPNLSLLISQLSNNEKCKERLQKYISSFPWQSGIISDQFKKIYLLLAGIPVDENINICEKLDWRRSLGLHLWYIAPSGASVDFSVGLYEAAFGNEQKYAEKPKPFYCESEKTDTKELDLMYHILFLYVSNAHRLSNVLHPPTHTNSLMDYRLSWLLMQLFISLEVGVIEDGEEMMLTTTFANQLEDLGHWKWAIFVLLFLEDNILKHRMIRRILERNLTPYTTIEVENELVNLFKIPPTWIHEVKAHMVKMVGSPYEIFQHLIYTRDWKGANEIFVSRILPELYINDHYEYLLKLLNRLEVGSRALLNWSSEAGFVKEFLQLQEARFSHRDQLRYLNRFTNICGRLCMFPTDNEYQRLCIAELSKKCALLFKVLYRNLDCVTFQAKFTDLLENLVMPPDYIHYEIFYFISYYVYHDRSKF